MHQFLQSLDGQVTGVLSGFDRLVLHGSLRLMSYPDGLLKYLCHHRILLKDFGEHSRALSDRVIEESQKPVLEAKRPVIYLRNSHDRKEDQARSIMTDDRVREGSICVFKTLELCRSYEIVRNHGTQRIELQSRQRKCLHLYHYMIHPVFGFMHVRLQTWYPFSLQFCLNGREWLSRQLDAAGIGYRRERNCFTHIDRLREAQNLMDRQLRAPWERLLKKLARQVNPVSSEFQVRLGTGRMSPVNYFWTVPQSEWATDVIFRSRPELIFLYERLIRHGITTYGPGDVLRFYGRRVKQDGTPWSNLPGEITSDVKSRSEGVRIKYRYNGNSLKMYDKGNVLRFETTFNEPEGFRELRRPEGDPKAKARWMKLRRGIASLPRRAEICQAANERLMEAQAALQTPQSLQELTAPLFRPVTKHAHTKSDGTRVAARRFRALNPLGPDDVQLISVVSRPEFHLCGFRNRDLHSLLFAPTEDPAQRKREAAKVSRQLALLRAHGLIRKVQRSHRYILAEKGRTTITALLAARNANVIQLIKLAV
jgi:hypothetical protein